MEAAVLVLGQALHRNYQKALDTPEYDQIEDMVDELEDRLGLHTLFAEELDLD